MLLEIAYRMVQSLTGKQLLGKVFRGERFLLPSKSWKAAPCCSKYPNLCQLRDSAMGPQLRCVAEPRDSVGIAVPAAWQGTACLVCACPECQGMYSGTGGVPSRGHCPFWFPDGQPRGKQDGPKLWPVLSFSPPEH